MAKNYVEQAKRLLIKTALVVVPLAAAVSHLEAGPVSLPISGSPMCAKSMSGLSGSVDCSSSVIETQNFGSAINGVTFTSASGGIQFPVSSGGSDTVLIMDGGLLAGSLSGTLLVSYDFTVSGGTFGQWLVGLSLGTGLGDVSAYGMALFGGDFGGASTGHASGSALLTLQNTPITGSIIEFTGIQVNVSSGSAMVLNFPLSFGPQDVATTPEPGSLLLLGAGLIWLGWKKRPG